MNDLLPFIVVGITTGSVYGLAALGLVLTYKTSGIFNFAHGAVAAVAAYAFYDLHAVRGLPWPVALLIAVVVLPPFIALLMERIARGLAGGTATAKIVATVGVQLAITSALIAHYGAAGLNFPGFLPTDSVGVLGVNVGIDQLIATVLATAGAVGLFAFFRTSRLGVRMRAVVDDPDLLGLAGTSAFRVRSWAWLIGCWFAALSGVLLAPQIGLDALLLTLLVVQAYGAAAVGYFTSLPLTYAGGVLIGVLAALATNFTSTGASVLTGLPPSMPFLVLFVVLLVAPRGKLVDAAARRSAPVSEPMLGQVAGRVVAAVAVVAAVGLPFIIGTKLPVYTLALVFVVIFYSLNLLVRTSGQVSLCHAAFVAVGASTFSRVAGDAGAPWPLAVLIAGLVAVPVGAIVAIPAIRLSGLYLALATFGFGLLLEQIAYRTEWMFGTTGNIPAPRPELLGFASDRGFYYVALAFAIGVALAITVVNRSRLGRLLRAMADSPISLTTLGLGVNVTRVTVFCVSAFIAGVGGALYASLGQSATGTPFTAFASLTWLAVLAIAGIAGHGRHSMPVIAALALVIVPSYITDPTITAWLPVFFGVGAVTAAIMESSPRRRGTGGTAPPGAATSRAAGRDGSSPVRERILAAEANRAQRPAAELTVTTTVARGPR